ncbi:MAG: class I SAM-dependent methyltransferase [Candidatus Omnitrophica bacterium]|nr:class I SAM-dependent methyltransferase [Candidatus Omnitrophota bacterium]
MRKNKINPRLLYLQMKKETILCPLCDSQAHQQLFGIDRHGMGLSTTMCTRCGFVFTNPRPTQEEMHRFYRETYRHFYTGNPDPDTEYQDKLNVEKRLWFFNRARYELIGQNGRSPAILDIGCGSGVLLHVFRSLMPESRLFGVEPYPFYAEYAGKRNDADVFYGDMDSFLEKRRDLVGSLDLATLYHVAEHLYDPVEKLLRLREFLKPSGLLLIQVPNLQSPHWQTASRLCHIAHVTHFSPETLRHAFELSGFQVIKSFAGSHPSNPRALTMLGRKTEKIASRSEIRPIAPAEIHSRIHHLRRELNRKIRRSPETVALDSVKQLVKLPFHLKKHGLRATLRQSFKLAFALARKMYHALSFPALKALWRMKSTPVFRRLLRDRRVLVIGSGPSAKDLGPVPEDVLILTCNAGLRLFLEKNINRPADIFLCRRKAMEEDYTDIEDLLPKVKAKCFVMDDREFVTKNPKLAGSYERLFLDHQKDNFYLDRLIRPRRVERKADNVWWTSAGMRLLQYALYFGASEVYLVGIDLNHSGYFWGEKQRYRHSGAVIRHKHPIDIEVMKILSEKYRCVYSASATSPITRFIPHKPLGSR